ncbi:MAG: hypothetical protein AB7G17_08595 [Phycisphaerales bacterium]
MGGGTRGRAGRDARYRAWWLALVGVFALLSGTTGPLAHAWEIAGNAGNPAVSTCGGVGVEEREAPEQPKRHAPDGCAVCLTIHAGSNAGVVGVGAGWSAPAALCVGVVTDVGVPGAGVAALDGARARGPPSDRA